MKIEILVLFIYNILQIDVTHLFCNFYIHVLQSLVIPNTVHEDIGLLILLTVDSLHRDMGQG